MLDFFGKMAGMQMSWTISTVKQGRFKSFIVRTHNTENGFRGTALRFSLSFSFL